MRALIPVLALSMALFAGCGDDDGGDGDGGAAPTEAATEAATGPETTEAAPDGEGPGGELSERGIGTIEAGAAAAEVERAFGAPDRDRELPGCELAGPNATPVLQWTWNLSDGALSIDFDVSSRELISYRTTSAELPTTEGVRVGDSFEVLRQSYGGTLKGLPLGAPANERVGLWYVGKPAKLWQLFDVRGGQVKNIQGGDIQICE
jgi:hypothetical protein